MANERMFLLHEPSGYYVYLAKRMGWGWYGVPDDVKQMIELLFDAIETQVAEGEQDAISLVFENDQRLLLNVRDLSEAGKLKFELNKAHDLLERVSANIRWDQLADQPTKDRVDTLCREIRDYLGDPR